ncbi:putative uncharacterized protein DDB_G0282133 [Dendropsophus ebraccatus]|uniref:putative uncharacterized protein DDB_G0282133 n=1 Tax=Dendropsophus ebraccatus TaxID=150705 RepID=UPI0038319AE4
MGAHIMGRSLLLCCLVVLLVPAYSLKCHTCVGNGKECTPTEVTCLGDGDMCSTSALYIDSFPCKVRKVFKGCINSTTPSKKLSISPNEMTILSLQQEVCNSDLCNTHDVSDPKSNLNDLYCYSCTSPGASCNSGTMKPMKCMGEQNRCFDMKVLGSFGDIADIYVKGCGDIPSCTKDLVFSSQTSSVSVQCCNGNHCNSNTDFEVEDKKPNGIQCYSCNTLGGASCAPEEVEKAQCYGELTTCLEVAGTSIKGDRPVPTIIKGCATPSMCDSSVLPLLQKLGSATVKCCNGSLCNSQFSESGLKASGYYLPTGNASPGTGIKNKHSSDASSGRHYDSSIKTGHHANNKYGTDSMSPWSPSYNTNCEDVNIFSAVNGPNMSPGNSNDEGIKGGSWNGNSNSGNPNPFNSYNEYGNTGSVHNPSITTTQVNHVNDLSIENPNSVYGSDIFSAGDLSTDNDGIFAEIESHTLSSSISYSYGEDNLSDDNSIPDTHPTFPDLQSFVDNNTFPNSYYDNNMNNPNNNDFNSYESVGFTDVVLADVDQNKDQSSSPTVVPNNIVSNNYGSAGNSGNNSSAYNPNITLSANNETSGHSMNSDSNVNRQEHNGSVQHLTSTTPRTHYSDKDQQTSGYGTNIHNQSITSKNVSGNYITIAGNNTIGSGNSSSAHSPGVFNETEGHNVSSPNNYLNNFSAVPGGSPLGGEHVSSTPSDSNDSSIPDVPPTFPDFTSSNGKVNQYSTPTVASNNIVSNNYDSLGNSGSNNSAYNTDIIILANNKETSGNSSDTINTGSSNGGIQNFTSTTSKTHNSYINQHISGHTDIASKNVSGNYIPSSGNASSAGGENASSTPSSSILDAHPTFPDFTSYVDSNINYPNDNDFNSYESAGFTDIVYTDMDMDVGQYSSPTVVPDSIVSNSYDSSGKNDFTSYESVGFTEIVYEIIEENNDQSSSPTVTPDISSSPDSVGNLGSDNSAYSPSTNLLANKNKTSDHSANGSNVIVQKNNTNSNPTTPKTFNSEINQQISGYSTNLYNTGNANTNCSRKNMSSSENNAGGGGNTFSGGPACNWIGSPNVSGPSGQNNLNTLSSGGSAGGREAVSGTPSYDSDSFPNALPTFPDFPSYVDSNMNYPNNNDLNSYESVGFTEVVYTDDEGDDGQSGSPTVVPGSIVSNSYDSVGGNNDWSSYESAGFTDIVLTDQDENNDQSNSPTVVPDSIPSNNTGLVGNNDWSSYESAGFTDIVLTDEDENNVQSNSPTVAPNGLFPNNSSACNLNLTLTSNNNETSGHSADTVNIGSNVNVQGNNPNIQHPTPATSKTHESDIKQHISGHGTHIQNTGVDCKNVSGNYIPSSGTNTAGSGNTSSHNVSSPIHYPSGENHLSVLSPGGSAQDHSNNNSIPDVPPTFPVFPSYVDSSIVPNSYHDNNMNNPNNNDFNSYESAGFTDVVYTDKDGKGDQSSSPTVVPDNMVPNSYHSGGYSGTDYSAHNPANNNKTNGHSSDTVNIASNVNRQGNNGSIQYLTTTTHKSDIKHHITGHGTNSYNSGIANNNGSGNYISSSGNYNAGSGNSSSADTSGSSSYGGHTNMPGSNESSTTYTGSGNSTGMTNGWNSSDNSSNYNLAVPVGYTNIPESNHTSPSYGSSSNGTGMTNEWTNSNDSIHNMAIPGGYNNIPGNNHSSTSYTGNETGVPNQWTNNYSSNMSVPGAYANIPARDGSSTSYTSYGNDSSHNMAIPVGYNNFPGNNHSSTSYTGNETGVPNQWTNNYSSNMSVPGAYANIPARDGSSTSYTSYGNDSSHNMAIPGGYNNFPGNNHSSTSYTGNETGVPNQWTNNYSSNMSVPGAYANIPGRNGSLTSYTSYDNDSSHNMAIPVGYSNIPGSNHSSTSYIGNGTGMSNEWTHNNSLSPNMSVPGAYANIPGRDGSSTSYTNSGNGTRLTNEPINSNDTSQNIPIPVGYSNIPGSNHSSTSYTGDGSGMSNESTHSNSFNPNMSVPGVYANIPGGNYTSTYDNGAGFVNEWFDNNNSTNGNSSSLVGQWDSIESYLNHVLSGANNNESYSNTSSWLDEAAWTNGFNYDPNMEPKNDSNASSNNYNNIQNFLSTLNGFVHGNNSKNVTEWIQGNKFLSSLLPPGLINNGSGPSGYNINPIFNGSLSDYFKNLGVPWNNSNINKIPSIFSGGNTGAFNISNLGSGLGDIMHNPNLMNPFGNHGGSSYSSERNPSNSGSSYNSNPNSNGYGGSGFNGQPNSNVNGMSSGGYNDGSINGNGYNSYALPPGESNNDGRTDGNGNSYNSNHMGHGQNGSVLENGHGSIPVRSTNDTAGGGGAGNSTGGGFNLFNSASSMWTKSGNFVIFSAIALLVLS